MSPKPKPNKTQQALTASIHRAWRQLPYRLKLQALRVAAGFRQADAARLARASRPALSAAENGRRRWNGLDARLTPMYAKAIAADHADSQEWLANPAAEDVQ